MTNTFELHTKFGFLENYLGSILTIFTDNTETIHKARNELKIIKLDGIKTVIKSFKVPHILNRIVYTFFRRSKAYRSYHHALTLNKLNVLTPQPISYVEFFSFGLLKESYFISEFYTYDFTLKVPLFESSLDRDKIIKSFVAFTYDLHQKGIWHFDLSPGNVLIKKNEIGQYIFAIVDINRMTFKPITPLEGCGNFNKLWASDEDILFMAREYAKLSALDESIAVSEMIRCNNAHKRIKNLKKRFKALLK